MTIFLALLVTILLLSVYTLTAIVPNQAPSFAVTLPVRAGPRPRGVRVSTREWPEPRPP